MNQMSDAGSAGGRSSGSSAGSEAMEKVHERAEVARDEVAGVADVARQEARSFADEAKSQVRSRIDEEGAHIGDSVRQFGSQLSDMGRNADDPESPAARTVAQVGQRVSEMADQYQDKGVQGMLDDLKGFARRHPGQFIFGAAAAGFVVGRLVRNVDTSAIAPSNGQEASSSSSDMIDLREGGERGVIEPPMPGSEPVAGAPSRAGGATRSSIAGVAGEEVGTW